jgi:hypothetical protein
MALDPVSAALDLGGKLLDHFFPDPTKKAEAALELLKLQQSGELAQMTAQTDINKVEAASPNLLVAGGRPAMIWCCVFIFAMNYLIGPLCTWASALVGHPTPFPQLDMAGIMPVLMGLLGLGAYRTYEKVNDSASNH